MSKVILITASQKKRISRVAQDQIGNLYPDAKINRVSVQPTNAEDLQKKVKAIHKEHPQAVIVMGVNRNWVNRISDALGLTKIYHLGSLAVSKVRDRTQCLRMRACA
jgi:hypothetical protein